MNIGSELRLGYKVKAAAIKIINKKKTKKYSIAELNTQINFCYS